MCRKAAYSLAKQSAISWTVNGEGYYCANIKVGSKWFGIFRHILNFYIGCGWLPDVVDHIDGIPGNDEPENLRAATRSQNQHNSKIRSDNKSGIKGVGKTKTGRWRGYVSLNGKQHGAGTFDTPEEAESAVKELRSKLHGEFAR